MAYVNIQLFAEDSEQTEQENVGEENKEVVNEENNEPKEETTTEAVEDKTTDEPEKVTFTQEQVDEMVKNRLKREKKKLDREYGEELSKYKELAFLTSKGLKTQTLEETLDKSRDFYSKQGIKYEPTNNSRQEELFANALCRDILDDCDTVEDIQAEADKIAKKGNNINAREKLVLKGLVEELENRQKIKKLSELGVDEKIYNSDSFREFEKQFTKETPIDKIYSLYSSQNKPTKKYENPGSMKTTPTKKEKDFISEADYDKMTEKEILDNMELIRKSMTKW